MLVMLVSMLETIFLLKHGIPSIVAICLQHWALTILGYQYDLVYRPSKENAQPECLSRLPLPQQDGYDKCDKVDSFFALWLEHLPIMSKHMTPATLKDQILHICWLAKLCCR